MLYRRFEIISKEKEDKLLELISEKSLSREDIILILNTIKIRNIES